MAHHADSGRPHDAVRSVSHPDRPQFRRALTWCSKLKLTDDDRHALAAYLLDHEGSWRTLSEDGARRIADSLQAFNAVQWLYADRRAIAGDGHQLPVPHAMAAAS